MQEYYIEVPVKGYRMFMVEADTPEEAKKKVRVNKCNGYNVDCGGDEIEEIDFDNARIVGS